MGHARPGAAEAVPVPLFGHQLVALAASVVVLVRPATIGPGPLVLALGVEGPPVPGLPAGIQGGPVVMVPAALPAQPVRVVLLPGPGVLALGVVVAAPLLVRGASAPGPDSPYPAEVSSTTLSLGRPQALGSLVCPAFGRLTVSQFKIITGVS